MPLELIADIVLTLTKLPLLMAFASTILFFVVGKRLNHYLKDKFGMSWISAAASTIFLVLLPIVFIAYLGPYAAGYFGSELAGLPAPEFMQPTLIDYAMAILLTIVKNLITVFVFTVLVLPLIFIASFFEEKLEERFKLPKIANIFVSSFATSLIVWILVFFFFPWVYTGVLELIWWGL